VKAVPEPSAGESPTVGFVARLISKAKDFVRSFLDLREAPWAFWCVIIFFMTDSMAYFGILTLMESYIQKDLGVGDIVASAVVSMFTLLVTLFMIGLGTLAEKRGIRGGLLLAILLCLVGRVAYSAGPLGGMPYWLELTLLLGGLVVVAVGEGMVQPVTYAGIKHFTSAKTSAMGYSLIYAFMNLGIIASALISTGIRVPVQDIQAARVAGTPEPVSIWRFFADWGISGMNAVNWALAAITAAALLILLFGLTKGAEAKARSQNGTPPAAPLSTAPKKKLLERMSDYFTEGPFANARFLFFIFMLLPVQTLFAHQWLTLPAYVLRDYSQEVADKME
jgi:MFS family permease